MPEVMNIVQGQILMAMFSYHSPDATGVLPTRLHVTFIVKEKLTKPIDY